MKSIALLTDGIWPYSMGGMQKHSYYMAKYLAKSGIKVTVFYIDHKSQIIQELSQIFTDYELSNIHFIALSWPKSKFSFPGHYIYENYLYSKSIYNSIKNELIKFDLIYAQGFSAWYLLKKRKNNVRPHIVVNFHGLNMFQKAPSIISSFEHLLFRPIVKYNLKKADYVISLGGKLNKIVNQYSNSSVNIPVGIEHKWIVKKEIELGAQLRFVFIGRYERVKGIEELTNVLKKFKGNYRFDFIGPIPERCRINDPRIFYHGAIYEEDQIIEILRSSDVLVSPSWSEGMPTVILEAMASGCAIVATNVGAVSEIVNAENGWLISPGNKKELFGTLNLILHSDSDIIMQKKQASLHMVQAYTWDKVIKKTIDTFS